MTKRKVNKVLISDILHLAADKYLNSCSGRWEPDTATFSCVAILMACAEFNFSEEQMIKEGLLNLGFKVSRCGSGFRKLEDPYGQGTKESQAARYFWLKWAALMAEEQGV